MSALSALVLVLPLLAPAAALAGEEVPAGPSPVVDQAEYVRLQQELEKLAARNAWAGVERTYQKMVATGVPPSFEDHVAAAHAARALGNAGAVHARLTAANGIKEDKQVLDWLWDIDSKYGRVYLLCELGKYPVVLEAESMPFNPDMRRAVEFSIQQVAETCEFDGLLPHGNYTFGGQPLQVARVQAVRLDLRNMEIPVEKKKKKKGKDDDADADAAE